MLSGGRTQFIALKANTPWLDINQERHEPSPATTAWSSWCESSTPRSTIPCGRRSARQRPGTKRRARGRATSEPIDLDDIVARLRKAFAETEAQDFEEC